MASNENKALGDKLLNFLVALILHEKGGHNVGHDVQMYVNNACLAQYFRESHPHMTFAGLNDHSVGDRYESHLADVFLQHSKDLGLAHAHARREVERLIKWVDENVDPAKLVSIPPSTIFFQQIASSRWFVRHPAPAELSLPPAEVSRLRLEAVKNCTNVADPQAPGDEHGDAPLRRPVFTEHHGQPMTLSWRSNIGNPMSVCVFPCCGQVVLRTNAISFSQQPCTQARRCDCRDHGVPSDEDRSLRIPNLYSQSNRKFELTWNCACGKTAFRLSREPAPVHHRIESLETLPHRRPREMA
jgi:hypothetical protein